MQPLRPWQRLALFGFALACMVGLGLTVANASKDPHVQAAIKGGKYPPLPGKENLAIVDQHEASTRTWPMFGGTLERNMVNLIEKNLPGEVDAESGKNVLWVVELGSQSYGNPVVADGKIFVGTNNGTPRNPRDIRGDEPIDKGVVMCFQEADGKFLWQAVHEKLESGRVNDWPEQGVCSSPFVQGNRLYYVSNRCELICADVNGPLDGRQGPVDPQRQDPTDADIIWKFDMMKELGVFPHNLAVCSPIVVGDNIFILTGNGHDESHENIPAPLAPSFICVDKKTGKPKWTNNYPGVNILHGQWSNPCYAVIQGVPQVIFAGGDGWVRAFDPDSGKELWKFDCNPKSAVYKLGGKGTRNYIIGTPVVWEDKVYINTGQDPEHGDGVGHLWCIDPAKARGRPGADLSPRNDNFDPKAPENRDSGLVWHVGGADARGELLWRRSLSTAAVKDGLLYICNLPGFICCFDARTGARFWEHDALTNIWGSCYVADGKVYVGTEEGDLLVFQEGKEKRLLGKYDMKAPVLSTPVAVNGVLYVMTKSRLYALKNK
jgi:outer membrane protein assembly factor BamB